MSKFRVLFYVKYVLVLPHLLCLRFLDEETRSLIISDVNEMNRRCKMNKGIAYYLLFAKPYRNLFYHRIGRFSHFTSCFLPSYKDFFIFCSHIGGAAFVLNHPYSTIINAKSIGTNFTCCQCTTIGNKIHGKNDLIPSIGNNVSLGANVVIIGDITIGDNVIIGAGSVVVKDVPSNCVVAGNPAKVLHNFYI